MGLRLVRGFDGCRSPETTAALQLETCNLPLLTIEHGDTGWIQNQLAKWQSVYQRPGVKIVAPGTDVQQLAHQLLVVPVMVDQVDFRRINDQ